MFGPFGFHSKKKKAKNFDRRKRKFNEIYNKISEDFTNHFSGNESEKRWLKLYTNVFKQFEQQINSENIYNLASRGDTASKNFSTAGLIAPNNMTRYTELSKTAEAERKHAAAPTSSTGSVH